jgi:lactobin A/cerein 7B family class IIb bacteriocin
MHMANQQEPVQPQTMTSQPESEELHDEQLEQISGGMGNMGKAGMIGAGILGAGALTEGAIGLNQNQQKINQTKQEEAYWNS